MKIKIALTFFLISFCLPVINAGAIASGNDLISITANSQQSSNNIPFKILKKPYAWDIKSVTYLGRKNGGYNIRITGTGTRDIERSMQVDVGYYQKGQETLTGTYYFPTVKKGVPFSTEIVIFLPNGLTPTTIDGLVFKNGFDYIEDTSDEDTEEEEEGQNDTDDPYLASIIEPYVPSIIPVNEVSQIIFRVYAPHKNISFETPSDMGTIVGPSRSTSKAEINIDNDKFTVEHTQYTYILKAEKTGNYNIPRFVVELEDGTIIRSPEHTISVKEIAEAEAAFKEKQDNTIEETEVSEPAGFIRPSYPGGKEALSAFISKNLKYPPMASEMGIQGTIKVGFTVAGDGKIKDIKIIEGGDRILEYEAKRLVNTFPTWIPATYNGRPASTDIVIPVKFELK